MIRILWVDSEGFTGGPAPDGGWQVTPDVAQIVAADALAILDVTPEPPAPAPAGVELTRLVDVGLARRTDRAVVVELPLGVVHGLVGTGVTTETCDTREMVFFHDERPGGALASMSGCRTVRCAILPDDGFHMSDDPLYGATLISIGAPVRESP